MEHRLAYLRPDQIRAALAKCPVIYVPIGPLEWHGPHLAYGVDAFNAERTALGVCEQTGGLVWATQFWGTERERQPDQLEGLGLDRCEHIVGMDFPGNPLPSAYCPEEVFAVLLNEILNEVRRFGARLAVIVNGHGAVNHNQVLHRLAAHFNGTTDLRVHVRIAFPRKAVVEGSLGHASAAETSLMMHMHPATVDVGALPPTPQPLHYADFGIVDGPGFDGNGPPDKTLPDEDDPRTNASAEAGRECHETIVRELIEEVRRIVEALS